ncbi:mobilization protein [Campylobacter helveticus]|uniref:mobilization protein n=1 Tax=Campylobacter helveticus TaxID=28898 RepID=UPI00105059CC|nr:mobilization protein [Campylobacter helveticus]QBL11327.1 mobilization protein [Campylobacter helveticus]
MKNNAELSNKNEENIISKRILFNKKSLEMINMMLPAYKDEIDDNLKESEKISLFINLCVEKMFKKDFLDRIREF